MPLPLRIPCPQCGKTLYRKVAGRCPACGEPVTDHVNETHAREERIEKIVAMIGTALVVLVFLFAGGGGLVEGVVVYVLAGAVMFYLAKRTFKPNRQHEES